VRGLLASLDVTAWSRSIYACACLRDGEIFSLMLVQPWCRCRCVASRLDADLDVRLRRVELDGGGLVHAIWIDSACASMPADSTRQIGS
jgi:hypothetical protein